MLRERGAGKYTTAETGARIHARGFESVCLLFVQQTHVNMSQVMGTDGSPSGSGNCGRVPSLLLGELDPGAYFR